jgi:hypothetical protein
MGNRERRPQREVVHAGQAEDDLHPGALERATISWAPVTAMEPRLSADFRYSGLWETF